MKIAKNEGLARILLDNTILSRLETLTRSIGPPLLQFSMLIIMSTDRIEGMLKIFFEETSWVASSKLTVNSCAAICPNAPYEIYEGLKLH